MHAFNLGMGSVVFHGREYYFGVYSVGTNNLSMNGYPWDNPKDLQIDNIRGLIIDSNY
jgi:hypothetical protein